MRRRVAVGKFGNAPLQIPMADFKFCIGSHVDPEKFFVKKDTGAGEVMVADISRRRHGGDFLVWLGYQCYATLPLYHVLQEIKGKVAAARGKHSKASWKGHSMLLELEVRGKVIQVLNNLELVWMVVDPDTYEPLPWLVQECAEDDKVVEAIAVG